MNGAGSETPTAWVIRGRELAPWDLAVARRLVGAHLQYLVYSRQGELLGALGWQSAVERLACRDRLVGLEGKAEWRARFLAHAVNNARFLILPRWRVDHLASAVLAEGLEH